MPSHQQILIYKLQYIFIFRRAIVFYYLPANICSVILKQTMVNKPIKVGVVGVGHLGQHHVKHYSSIKETDLIGLFDIDTIQARKIAEQYNTSAFS